MLGNIETLVADASSHEEVFYGDEADDPGVEQGEPVTYIPATSRPGDE